MTTLITMTDIARLANVKRQAVTNWRSRPASAPFPTPMDDIAGVLRFDRDKVVEWLETTGRGNNSESRLDAPTVAVPDGLDIETAAVLVALRSKVFEDLGPLSGEGRVALAEEIDPDDHYLLAEVRDLADRDDLFEFVDGLFSATYGGSDALARLYETRSAQGTRGLTPGLVDLMRAVANACRNFLGPDDTSVAMCLDPRDRDVALDFSTACRTGGVSRSMLRHLAAEGLSFDEAMYRQVRMFSTVGVDDLVALEQVDEVALELEAGQVAVVVGSASALCDRLTGDRYEARRATLEMGGGGTGGALVAAFKLPRGLWREAYRQSLGLWVLSADSPAVGVVVADLSGRSIDPVGLADDVLGALEQTGARAYQYGRSVRYAEVWTRDTVVLPGIGAVPSVENISESAYADAVEATLVTRDGIAGLDIDLLARVGATRSAARSLGELVDRRVVKLQSGCRISTKHLDPAGSIPVLSADPDIPAGHLDALTAADNYSHAVRTEPGDVVFSTSPPRAFVDEEGGARVMSPSRILRIDRDRAGIGPRALAAAINAMAGSTEWRAWPIPLVPQSEMGNVESALGEALQYLKTLRRNEQAAESLITNLIQGVADGSVALGSSTTERKAS